MILSNGMILATRPANRSYTSATLNGKPTIRPISAHADDTADSSNYSFTTIGMLFFIFSISGIRLRGNQPGFLPQFGNINKVRRNNHLLFFPFWIARRETSWPRKINRVSVRLFPSPLKPRPTWRVRAPVLSASKELKQHFQIVTIGESKGLILPGLC